MFFVGKALEHWILLLWKTDQTQEEMALRKFRSQFFTTVGLTGISPLKGSCAQWDSGTFMGTERRRDKDRFSAL